MNLNPVILSIPIYFLLILIELIVQFVANRKIYRLNDAIANISCGITSQISSAFFKIFTIAAYQFVFENWSLFNIPITWWSVSLLVLLVDMCYYWAQRMSHEVNLFWGGHVVHHQSEDYNFSVAFRQGSFQILWTFWFYLPLAIIGFETGTFLIVSAWITVYQFWIHTETIGKLPKPIEYVFNTPSHHRVHHGRDPKYIDKNHAGFLIVWDKMFGTFQKEEEKPTYGITKPINSWNPVWVNLEHYVNMGKLIVKTPSTYNKLNVLFNKPGWRTAEMGGYEAPSKVERCAYRKYDNHPKVQASIYSFFHFIIMLGFTSYFLFQIDDLPLTSKLGYAVFIIWTVMQIGLVIDQKVKWNWLEYLRLCMIGTFIFVTQQETIIIIASLLICTISIIWFFLINRSSIQKKSFTST